MREFTQEDRFMGERQMSIIASRQPKLCRVCTYMHDICSKLTETRRPPATSGILRNLIQSVSAKSAYEATK